MYENFQVTTENTSAANIAYGKTLINDTQRLVLSMYPWPFLEFTGTKSTIDGQNYYELPAKLRKITSLMVSVGTTQKYLPKPIEDPQFWEYLQSLNTGESDVCQYYYALGTKVYLYPTPASTGSTITIRGRKRWKDMSLADYATGTITTATLNDETIVGSGTSWTARKPIGGQWMRIAAGATAGDYEWYEIASITNDTNLELVKPYEGVSIAAGSATYNIGEFSLIPSEYHDLLLYRSAMIYFLNSEQDMPRADRFGMLYDGGFEMGKSKKIGGLLGAMIQNAGEKNEGAYMEPQDNVREDLKRFHINSISGESW